MNLLKCNNGHYYDGDKFDTCPHCAGGAAAMDNIGDVTVPLDVTVDDGPAVVDPTEPMTGRTEPIIPKPIVEDTEKTVGWWDSSITGITGGTVKEHVDPVVGWLVCVEGKEIGKSFNLKAGKNFIGRNAGVNDVVLSDTSVSREKHAIVIFDPKSRTFLAQPGMSSELFYLNDAVVLQALEIKQKDLLQIGNTKLMFVPFCDAEFIWDDCKKGE